MGYRFSLEQVNWLAYILHAGGAPMPDPPDLEDSPETLRRLLADLQQRYVSFSWRERRRLRTKISSALRGVDEQPKRLRTAVRPLRQYFGQFSWFALLIPSGVHPDTDQLLTSHSLLEELTRLDPGGPGLILQLDHDGIPLDMVALQDVFPAFRTALKYATKWPGVLVWTTSDDSTFLEVQRDSARATESLRWIFSSLSASSTPNLSVLREEYYRTELPPKLSPASRPVRILHISDLHLGHPVAARRLPRIQNIIRSLMAELGDAATIIPVITGDLMDTPGDLALDSCRSFLEFLRGLGTEPVTIIGNHDVRHDGWLDPRYEQALYFPREPVLWLDQHRLGLLCFNSVRGGRLARGSIGEREFTDLGNILDRNKDRQDYTLLALLHHHPIPVERPPWYVQTWYERVFWWWGFAQTEDLEDASAFLEWCIRRRVVAVLHGHKHIPRVTQHSSGLTVVGCGSTSGLVPADDEGRTYISLNVLTLDQAASRLSCELWAERIPGAGLESQNRHVVLFRGK